MKELYQHSHFIATNQGLYDGTTTISALKAHGSFGLGTFHSLEGELLAIDGKFYHCTEGRNVRLAEQNETLPWAALSSFSDKKNTAQVKSLGDYKALEAALRSLMQSSNYPFLFHISGKFENILIGSVPKQEKPYLPIEAVIESSITVETGEVVADLVGFFAPDFMFPIKGKGFHLHCLEKNMKYGGHVLDLKCQELEVTYEQLTHFNLELPVNELYKNKKLSDYKSSEHVPVFTEKITQNNESHVIGIDELIETYEEKLPYHRNNIDEEAHFEKNLPKIALLLQLLKGSEDILNTMSNQTLKALIKLVRRASEYMLSVKRGCDYAIEYNTWVVNLLEKHAIQGMEREHITLLNHLGFAYYFLTEMGQGTTATISKARQLFETVLGRDDIKTYPDLWAYAHIVLAEVELHEHDFEHARELLITAYSFYKQKRVDAFDQNEAIRSIQADIKALATNLHRDDRNNRYQAMVVLGYIADTALPKKQYEFCEQCYKLCIAFIKAYWGDDTLQSADLYTRLAKLYRLLNKAEKSLEAYQNAFNIYERISGKSNSKLQKLTEEMHAFGA